MLTGEAIETMAKIIRTGETPRFVKHPDLDGRHVLVQGGEIVEGKRPPYRDAYAVSLDGLIGMLDDLATDKTRVYVGDTRVVALLNDSGDRLDRIELSLSSCESWRELSQDDALGNLTQSEAVWKMRSTFAGGVSPGSLLPSIRSLKFNTSKTGYSDAQHGRESMGVDVESAITSSGEAIPETVALRTPMYDQLAGDEGWPGVAVQCALRVNVEERSITFRPVEGEIERARDAARRFIAERIQTWNNLSNAESRGVVVFVGADAGRTS